MMKRLGQTLMIVFCLYCFYVMKAGANPEVPNGFQTADTPQPSIQSLLYSDS